MRTPITNNHSQMTVSETIRRNIIARIKNITDLAPKTPGHFVIEFESKHIAEHALPGQFVHVLPPSTELMLRRPFSIMTVDKTAGSVTFLFRVIGDGTKSLSEAKHGDSIDIIGPLGNGFPVDLNRPAIIAGGGVGIPPLVYLAQFLRKENPAQKTQVFLGARNPETMLCVENFRELGIEPVLATEDGSLGVKGYVTDAMNLSRDSMLEDSVIYSCGPVPMLSAISRWAKTNGLKCFVSMENKLGCGIGACLGCSIPVRTEQGSIRYERVCCDGPAFDSDKVVFEKI